MKPSNLRLTRKFSAAITMLALTFLPAALFADGDPVGNWNITVDMAGTEIPATMTVTKNDDGSLAGKLTSPMGEAELTNVSFDGNKLAFTQTFGEGDTAIEMSFEGTLDGDSFSGMLNSDMGEMAVNGTRALPGDPTGDWDITVDMAGTEIPASMTVTRNNDGSLTGKLTSPMGEAELTNVTFEGSDLAFTQTFGEGDAAIEMAFEGTLDGDTFSGMLTSDMGEMAVNGKRKVGISGTWALTSDSELGVTTLPFVINKDMTATFSEYDVENLVLNGSTLTFEVTVDIEGTELPLEFEGDITDAGTIEGVFLMQGAEVATVVIARASGAPGTWNITSDSQLGVVEHVLVFTEDGTGTIDETELNDLVIDGNVISFQVELEVEGQFFDLTFEGAIDGSAITGEFLMEGAPVADIEGTRAQ